MTVLVCGGRTFRNRAWFVRAMAEHAKGATHILQGGAPGADLLAFEWALANDVTVTTYDADWTAHGPAGGPIRNQRMLDEGKPDLVVAFPGTRGTADMVKRAKAAGVRVVEVAL